MQEQKTIIISVIGYGDVILLQRQNANILNVMMDMTEQKRYYEKNYEEQYYIFDSNTLTEKEFEKKVEYDGYDLFADSLTSKEILDLLNENEQLKKQLSSINQLIDNKIDEFKNGDYGDLPCNTIHMFLDLKQEIGDVE